MSVTWILIADASRARLLSAAPEQAPAEIAAFTHPEGRMSTREARVETLPRTHDRMGSARHAIEPRTKFKDVEAARFARTLCDRLESGRVQREFDRLVLVAPARVLGMLHASMGRHLQAMVVAETRKDLVSAPRSTLFAHLAKAGQAITAEDRPA